MKCPRCQHDNAGGVKFCGECGARLALVCSACGSANPASNHFCGDCGASLGPASAPGAFVSPRNYTPRHLAEKILTTKSALEGERKQVTVLFADLVSSTAVAERIGAEAMHGLLSRFFELALREIHRYEGTVNQFLGDGFMALFGAPIAHEDHAQRAVLAAWAIQRELREHLSELPVRMGLNTGRVIVGAIGDNLRMDYTAVGDTTNVAARLQHLAEPGTVLVGEATLRLVGAHVRTEAMAPVTVKGRKAPIRAHKIVGLGPRRSPLEARADRALSRFVGRERELATLRTLLSQAERGQGQVVGISGEPGLGKSRLLHEFRLSLGGRALTYLEGRCLSYGTSIPYLPVLDVVRQNCGIADADTPEGIVSKLCFGLQEVGVDAAENMPYLLRLLGVKETTDALEELSPETVKAHTFETLRQWTLRGSWRRPLILTVEDLHWIDRTSEEYLASLVEHLAGAPLLLIATYRPGHQPSWLSKSYATQIALPPLSPDEDHVLLRSTFGAEEVPEPLERVILEKAEGNPFFLEELSRAILEVGGQDTVAAVPDTIQGVLMARIDRLPADPKRLLQTASVLGRSVPARLLDALWNDRDTLPLHLAELRRLEFLYDEIRGNEPVYLFKHVLTQEVAYDSLLSGRRQALHAAAGRALESLYADRLEQVYDRLAYHYTRTSEAPKAVEYLTRQAEKAARSFAHADAVTALQTALARVEALPSRGREPRRFELLIRESESLYYLGRFQDVLDLLVPHRERLDALRDPRRAATYYYWLTTAYTFLGDRRRAAQTGPLALENASRSSDRVTLGLVYIALTLESCFAGQLRVAVEHGCRAVALLDGTPERAALGMAHYCLGTAYHFTAAFEPAMEHAASADAIGTALGDRRLRANAAVLSCMVQTTLGEAEVAITAGRRALEHSPDDFERALALGHLGAAHLAQGDPTQALPMLEQALALADRFRSRQVQASFRELLATAYLATGHIGQARETGVAALAMSQDIDYLLGGASAQWTLGLIEHTDGNLDLAQNRLDQALAAMTSLESRYGMGRVRMDLAQLAHACGRPEAARAHLEEARTLFRTLRVPRYEERVEQLARQLSVPLAGG